MEKREQANQYFKDGEYEQAIELYTELLENNQDEPILLSNRSASYIKLEQYDLALEDAVKSTKLKPEWGKAWGRLGASLYGLEQFDESLVAYNKANELEPSEIYTQMINQIKSKMIDMKEKIISETTENPKMGDLFNSVFDSVMSNPKILEKLTDPEFQSKVLSMQSNPLDAINDSEIMSIMGEMMKSLKL